MTQRSAEDRNTRSFRMLDKSSMHQDDDFSVGNQFDQFHQW